MKSGMILFRAAFVFGLVLFAGIAPAVAQDGAAVPPVSAQNVVDQPPTVLERFIYIPYKNLAAVFQKQGATIVVPLQEYLDLWNRANAASLKANDPPPVPGLIQEASYVATVEQDTVRIRASLKAISLVKGWAVVPLRFGDAAIGKFESSTGKVLLQGLGNGNYALLISAAGEHQLTLELTAKIRTSPEGRIVELQVPTVGLTNWELVVPEADQVVTMTPKLAQEQVPPAEGVKETRVRAKLGATDKITAEWHPRVGNKPDMELLSSATNLTQVSVEDGLIHTSTFLTFDVLRGQLERVRLAVPKDHRILDVTADQRVREWKTEAEENRQIVTIELLARAERRVTVEVHTERAVPEGSFSVAGVAAETPQGVHALDVLRESGQISIRSGSDVTLTAEQQQRIQRADEGEINERIRRPGAVYYKYFSPDFVLTLVAKPVEPRLTVTHDSLVVFRDDQIRLRDRFQYLVEKAGVFELRFQLPENFTWENVACEGMKQFDVDADTRVLTIMLQEKRQGNIAAEITGFIAQDEAEKKQQPIPQIVPQGVALETGKLRIYAPEAIDVLTELEQVIAAQPDPAPAAEQVPNARLVSAWTFNRRPVEIPATTVRRPTRLLATVASKIDVRQGQTVITTTVVYDVQFAGLDTFRISVPAAFADQVQITANQTSPGSPAIKQKSRGAAEDGWVTWTIVMQREVLGQQSFTLTADLQGANVNDGQTSQTKISLPRVLEPPPVPNRPPVTLSRVVGEVTVTKDRALSVGTTSTGGDVEPIDVRELTQLPQDGLVAYRYFRQPVEVELTVGKLSVQGVVETVVSRALVEIVIDKEGMATYRSRYLVKTSERQRLRIDLPKGIEVLGAIVDRKQVMPEVSPDAPADTSRQAFSINVARTTGSDVPFQLAVLYRWKLTPGLENNGGDMRLLLPKVGETAEGSSSSVVQQMKVAIWVPDEYVLVTTPKGFTLESKTHFSDLFWHRRARPVNVAGLDQWIGETTSGLFEFPREGRGYVYNNLGGASSIEPRWWYLPFYAWVISGAIVLIAFVLRRTSWENKLTIVLVAAFLAVSWALQDPEYIRHLLAAASYGLIIMIGLWVVSCLVGERRATARPIVPPPEAPPADPAGPTPIPSVS